MVEDEKVSREGRKKVQDGINKCPFNGPCYVISKEKEYKSENN